MSKVLQRLLVCQGHGPGHPLLCAREQPSSSLKSPQNDTTFLEALLLSAQQDTTNKEDGTIKATDLATIYSAPGSSAPPPSSPPRRSVILHEWSSSSPSGLLSISRPLCT